MNNNNNGFLGGIPVVTRNILIINVLVFLAINLIRQIDLTQILGMHYIQAKTFYLYQFITYMFTHHDFGHLFFNMFAVFMFGRTMESFWGPKKYLIYYLVTGIGAGIVQQITSFFNFQDLLPFLSDPSMAALLDRFVVIGASGSVFGLLLAFGMTFPNAPIYIMFIPIPIKAKYMVIGYGVLELVFGISGSADGVAHFAHLGGMLFGIFMILYWKKKNKNNNGFYF